MRRILWVAVAAMTCAACGPIDYINTVAFKASRAVAEAEASNAVKLAPYEYWSAKTYLHMAREMGSRADFQLSIEYGETAIAMGQKARKLSIEKGEEGPAAQRDTQAPVQVMPKPTEPGSVEAGAGTPEPAETSAPAETTTPAAGENEGGQP